MHIAWYISINEKNVNKFNISVLIENNFFKYIDLCQEQMYNYCIVYSGIIKYAWNIKLQDANLNFIFYSYNLK